MMQVIEFVKKHVGTYTPLLAGNSVYMDFLFLKVTILGSFTIDMWIPAFFQYVVSLNLYKEGATFFRKNTYHGYQLIFCLIANLLSSLPLMRI